MWLCINNAVRYHNTYLTECVSDAEGFVKSLKSQDPRSRLSCGSVLDNSLTLLQLLSLLSSSEREKKRKWKTRLIELREKLVLSRKRKATVNTRFRTGGNKDMRQEIKSGKRGKDD